MLINVNRCNKNEQKTRAENQNETHSAVITC